MALPSDWNEPTIIEPIKIEPMVAIVQRITE
jgi:hypothetical protein